MTVADTQTTTPITKPPSTWKTVDGSEVSFAEARLAWADAAYGILRDTAGRYNEYVTYRALADSVQAQSGIQTRLLMRNWVGKVLLSVSERCLKDEGQPLTALCVQTADETVSDSYAYLLELKGEPVPDDIQLSAARARLECYQAFGATMPFGGGKVTLTRKVARVRDVAAAKRRMEIPPVLCATCNVQVPASGKCDECEN